MLSPLRFHYDSEQFNLPVRLGLINSAGDQDLIVNILARERHEVANYPNAFIPTNLDVKASVRARFGEFYVSLFDAVLARTPGVVVTEYAWQANNCDPCPQDPLSLADLVTLGADALPRYQQQIASGRGELAWTLPGEFVLTRLHARYARESLGEDLVFRAAGAMVGGREDPGGGLLAAAHHPKGEPIRLAQGVSPGTINNFQARYIIRHPWTGKVECTNPDFGRWGAPPAGHVRDKPQPARGLAFAARGGSLAHDVDQDVPAIAVVAAAPVEPRASQPPPRPPREQPTSDTPAALEVNRGCGCRSEPGAPALLALAGLLARPRRRR